MLETLVSEYARQHEGELDETARAELKQKLFEELDYDKTGSVDLLEFRVFMTRKFETMFRRTPKSY